VYVCGCVCLCVCVLHGRLLEHNPLGRQRIMLVDSTKILLKAIVVEDVRYLEFKKDKPKKLVLLLAASNLQILRTHY
jgi:hypothetical protein